MHVSAPDPLFSILELVCIGLFKTCCRACLELHFHSYIQAVHGQGATPVAADKLRSHRGILRTIALNGESDVSRRPSSSFSICTSESTYRHWRLSLP